MLGTDNTKRMLLQQHLLQRSLTHQFAAANGRQLQTPTMGSSSAATSVTASGASLSSLHQAAAAAVGLGRDMSLSPQQQQQSQQQQRPLTANLLLRLLAAEQENKLKRRLSEMQQQHRQQQQQQQQQILLAATQGRIERRPASFGLRRCGQDDNDFLASLHQRAIASPTLSALLAAPMKVVESIGKETKAPAPVFRSVENDPSVTKKVEREPLEKLTTKKPKAASPTPSSTSSTGGVSRKDARWREMYEELLAYKAKTGTCTVPRGYPENPRLASWVAEQRKQYKLMKDGRQSSITAERVELLDRVEFAWNAQEAAWEKHMRDLKAFRAEHGHTHCQLGDLTYPKLGLWVKEQRRHYTLMKQGKQSHMTEARCVELDSVGFCWDTHEATWLERLNELRAFKEANGNCIVPTNYPENPKLGTWIHHQRRQYKKYKEGKPCHITAERIKALDSLGFVWHPRDKNASAAACAGAGDKRSPVTETDLTDLDLRPRKRQRA